jgi:hypothetical protein
MTHQMRFIGISVIAAAVLVSLAVVMWPSVTPASAGAAGVALAYVLIGIECLASGAGIAFLAYAFPRSAPNDRRLCVAAYLSVGFLLINWWPHIYLRALTASASDVRPLLKQGIYLFHDVFMLAAAVLALFLTRTLSRRLQARAESSRRGWFGAGGRVTLVAVGVAVVSLPLTSLTYSALRLPSAPIPSGLLLPGLLLNTAITRLALGAGVAFLIYGWPLVKSSTTGRPLNLLAYGSVVWCLICWLPYQQIDFLIPYSGSEQLALAYAFHVTLIAAATVLAAYFLGVTRPAPMTRAAPIATAVP